MPEGRKDLMKSHRYNRCHKVGVPGEMAEPDVPLTPLKGFIFPTD
jgi:hypothetical protein